MNANVPRAADAPPREIPIARVGQESWLSFHLFCPPDRDALLAHTVQPVVAQVWSEGIADSFFFIRASEAGDHVRLGLRVAPLVDAAAAADRAFALLRAREGLAAPMLFEPEIDRYGGPRYLPRALSYFALSSMDALRFATEWSGEPRAKQLSEIFVRLGRQAIGMARTASELCDLADYAAEWRPHMPSIPADADRVFESRGAELTGRIREVFAASAAGALSEAPLVHARWLVAALRGLEGGERWRALSGQIHMTANRLGLSMPEESYLSALLCRCLDALGDELRERMAVATRHRPRASVGAAPDTGPARTLEAMVIAGMHALFGRGAGRPGVARGAS